MGQQPGGHLFLSTIARTPLAYLITIFAAEDVLRRVSFPAAIQCMREHYLRNAVDALRVSLGLGGTPFQPKRMRAIYLPAWVLYGSGALRAIKAHQEPPPAGRPAREAGRPRAHPGQRRSSSSSSA